MSRSALILCFLLGAWSAATVFMWQTAIKNFAVAESVLSSDEESFRSAVGDLSDESLRLVLRYQASEVNRLFFRGWGWIQLPLAAGVCLLAWRSSAGRFLAYASGIMFLIVIVLAAYVVPETVRLGRMMDFAARSELSEVRSMFWTLHHSYTGLDMLKLALAVASFGLVWSRTATRAPDGLSGAV